MLKVVIDAGKSIKAQDRQQQIKQMLPGGSAFSRKYFYLSGWNDFSKNKKRACNVGTPPPR